MAEPITIRSLTERILLGTVRIPRFQRGFVWEPERVAFLLDSIYRGYPIGTILFWRSEERLSNERDLGPFKLPEPAKRWPIDYVLDGQQRLTSLFGVFQHSLHPVKETADFDVYFDMAAPEGALEEQFVAGLEAREQKPNLFPMRLLFDAPGFTKRIRNFSDEQLNQITELQRRFQETQIPVEVIDFKDREQIAIIFERVNRAGVPLDTYQLLAAWTWNNEFDLSEKIGELGEALDPYNFDGIEKEQDLLLKCFAAITEGDASAKTIIDLHGPTVRDRFDTIRRGVLGAIEFLRTELNVYSLEVMPYPAMLVPLSRFFATERAGGIQPTAKQALQLRRWFWRACFSRRYSSGVGKAHAADIAMFDILKKDEDVDIAKFSASADESFFIEHQFNVSAVNTKTFILLLAAQTPRSLLGNSTINLEETLFRCNRSEFHHIFPKKHLKRTGIDDGVNCLANFCFLSSADNQAIKDKSPSGYTALIPEEIRSNVEYAAVLPAGWSSMSFEEFIKERGKALAARANSLMSWPSP